MTELFARAVSELPPEPPGVFLEIFWDGCWGLPKPYKWVNSM